MELDNFSFSEDLIGVEVEDQYLDLHNNYDFKSCEKKSDTVVLKWSITHGDYVPEGIPRNLTINIEGVTFYEKRGEFVADIDFDELGFFEDSSLGKVEYSGASKPAPRAGLLLFRFIDGAEIAVIGKSASCIL